MGDPSSGWTLGYLLNLTNTVPQDSPTFLKGIEPGVWSLLLVLFVVLLTGSFMRISYRVMVKENSFSNRNSSVFDDDWQLFWDSILLPGVHTEITQMWKMQVTFLEDSQSLISTCQHLHYCPVRQKTLFCRKPVISGGSQAICSPNESAACTDLAWAAAEITHVHLTRRCLWAGRPWATVQLRLNNPV